MYKPPTYEIMNNLKVTKIRDYVLGKNTIQEKYLCSQNHRHIACYNNNSQKRFLIYFKENVVTLFSLTDFQDFPVLENVTITFKDFPGFPGPVRTVFHYNYCVLETQYFPS